MRIDWSSLDAVECLSALEMLLESDCVDDALDYSFTLRAGTTALLAHASVCCDEAFNTSMAALLRDVSMNFENIGNLLLEYIGLLPMPVPYLEIFSVVFASTSSSITAEVIHTLKAMVQQDSELLLHILKVLCDLSSSPESNLALRSLIVNAIDFISEDNLPHMLRIITKYSISNSSRLNDMLYKFYKVLFKIGKQALNDVIGVFLEVLPADSKISNTFLSFISECRVEATEIDTHIDTILVLICFSNHSNKSNKALNICRLWLLNGIFPFTVLSEVIASQLSRCLLSAVWRLCRWLLVEIPHLSLPSHFIYDAYAVSLAQVLVQVCTQDESIKDAVISYLAGLAFESDVPGTRVERHIKQQLPSLGEAALSIRKKFSLGPINHSTYKVAAFASRMLLEVGDEDSCRGPVGSILYSGLLNRLIPDNDSNVFMIPPLILSQLLHVIMRCAHANSELESALLITIQKLLGSVREGCSLMSIMFHQKCEDTIQSTYHYSVWAKHRYGLIDIGLMMSSALLVYHRFLNTQDKAAVITWLARRLLSHLGNNATTIMDTFSVISNCNTEVSQIHMDLVKSSLCSLMRRLRCVRELGSLENDMRGIQLQCLVNPAANDHSFDPSQQLLLVDELSAMMQLQILDSDSSWSRVYELRPFISHTMLLLHRTFCLLSFSSINIVHPLLRFSPEYIDYAPSKSMLDELMRWPSLANSVLESVTDTSIAGPTVLKFLLENLVLLSCLLGHAASKNATCESEGIEIESTLVIVCQISSCRERVRHVTDQHLNMCKVSRVQSPAANDDSELSIRIANTRKRLGADVLMESLQEMTILINRYYFSMSPIALAKAVIYIHTNASKLRCTGNSASKYLLFNEACLNMYSTLVVQLTSLSPCSSRDDINLDNTCFDVSIMPLFDSSFRTCKTPQLNAQRSLTLNEVACTAYLSHFDAAVAETERLRKVISPNLTSQFISAITISVDQGPSILQLGRGLEYGDLILYTLISYLLIHKRLLLLRSRTSSSRGYVELLLSDVFMSSVLTRLNVDHIPLVMRREYVGTLGPHFLYVIIERQVKINQDATVAMSGFRVLAEMSRDTCVQPRCAGLAYLLSTFVFTTDSPLLNADNASCDILLAELCQLLDFNKFATTKGQKRDMQKRSCPLQTLVNSTLKYLNIQSAHAHDSQVSAAFWLAWWLLERVGEKIEGIALVLVDVMFLIRGDACHSASKSRTKLSPSVKFKGVDSLSALSPGMTQSAIAIQTSPSSTERTPTPSSSTKKLKRIIVEEETEEAEERLRKKRIRAPVFPVSKSRSLPRHVFSFTSLTAESAPLYFELSFSLLPATLLECLPTNILTNTGSQITSGPYTVAIGAMCTIIWTLQELVAAVRQEEKVKFLLTVSSVATRVCGVLIEAVHRVVLACAEWRNEQNIGHDDSYGTADIGSLEYLAVLVAWAVELVNQVKLFLSKFKQFFLDEGNFNIKKSVARSVASTINKCEKYIKLLENVAVDHSLELGPSYAGIRLYLCSYNSNNMEAWIMERNGAFKARKVAAVESHLTSDWVTAETERSFPTFQNYSSYEAGIDESTAESSIEAEILEKSQARGEIGWALYDIQEETSSEISEE